jgi:Cof subfamily protein (haloacid dehalogenase superfamily)
MRVFQAVSGKRPKLIGTDLDGTIVADDGSISERTKIALMQAHESGIHIYFVTGRPIRWMVEIKKNFNFGLGICSNGAMLYDFINGKILEEWPISVEVQLETVKILRELIPLVTFAVEFSQEFRREKRYAPKWDIGIDNVGFEIIEEVMNAPALKILARCTDGKFSSDEMLALANKALDGMVTVTHSNSTESLLEISAKGVSKGSTLSKIAIRHGLVAEDCVTFGDNPNDFSMLSWASRSWAMADGHADLMKYAKFKTDGLQEDGVAKVLEKLVLLEN